MESKQIAPETNEEILKRNGMDLGFWSPDTSSKILKSMQAYADQEKRKEAIAFARWLHDNCYMITPMDEWRLAETFERHTTEALYDLYPLSLTKTVK